MNESYLPDHSTRKLWSRYAQKESEGSRRRFWRTIPSLPPRPADAHKGTFGTALLIGGSRGMAGAVALAGAGALVSGAGLTRLAVPDRILETVAQFQREYTTIGFPNDTSGRLDETALEPILTAAQGATAVGVGPGLGRSEGLDRLVTELFFELRQPAVFDADALNALAASGVFSETPDPRYADRFPKGARVFTPHPGEFRRLVQSQLCDVGATATDEAWLQLDLSLDTHEARKDACVGWFKRYVSRFCKGSAKLDKSQRRPATLLLKGERTVVTELRFPEIGGHKLVQSSNRTGNPNLATGGSGDVLTGIVVGLIAQGVPSGDAARIGAAVHGLAAELRATICTRGATAGDVVRFLPPAFDYYTAAREACQ